MAAPGHPPGALSALPRYPGFKVVKLLGKGSYGKVYKVERESDKQLYALKEADLGAMSQVERMDAVNEVRLLVSINHVNVIRYNEAFLTGNKLCTVMEFAPFGDLRYYIGKGLKLKSPFPEEAIWRIFLQLCRGLESLHQNNIIHRDIKPANIFLCQNDLLKIGDLGIAKALTSVNFARTQIGTPCYMAPEVWAGRPYSYSSDMWSLGSVLYEMMTFKVPMEGRSMQELKSRIINGRYSPISGSSYSPELVNFCYALLNSNPKSRPSPTAILATPAAAKWMRVLPEATAPARRNSDGAKTLLDTIVVPRDLKQLPKKLPPPCYDNNLPTRPPSILAPLPSTAGPGSNPGSRPNSGSKPPTPLAAGGGQPSSSSAPGSRPNSGGRLPTPMAGENSNPFAPSRGHTPAGGRGRGAGREPGPAEGANPKGSAANSKPASREGSRQPSPLYDVRAVQDNNRRPGVVLPPLAPRPGSVSSHHPLVAAAAQAAQAAYHHQQQQHNQLLQHQQRWTPSGPQAQAPALQGLRGLIVPPQQRRVSFS